MEKIYLSGKNSHLFALVDIENYEDIKSVRWYLNASGYAQRNRRMKNGKWDNIPVLMHRVIKLISDPTVYIDHINGNKLDNRKQNLRTCSIIESNFSRGIRVDNTSGIKGVHFHRKTGKWMARVAENRNRHYLGLFDTKEEAEQAYIKLASKLHGDFMRLK